MTKTLRCTLIIVGLVARNTVSLRCYFCKSDYNSGMPEDEKKAKDIPYCGREPYVGDEGHVVDCSIYFDNAAMIHPTFREALSSTTQRTSTSAPRKYRKRGLGESGNQSTRGNEYLNGTRITEAPHSERNTSAHVRSLRHNVYPYNLSNLAWGSQSRHERVSPYHCLTVHTFNSSFPNRLCGLRYFLDCGLLVELTSEPLKPSSFIKNCNECKAHLCNGATTVSSVLLFVTYSSAIHRIFSWISQP